MIKKFLVGIFVMVCGLSFCLSGFAGDFTMTGNVDTYGFNQSAFNLRRTAPSGDRGLFTITKLNFDKEFDENAIGSFSFINERIWGGNSATSGNVDVYLNTAYIQVKKDFLSLRVGRQPIVIGSGLLVSKNLSDESPLAGTSVFNYSEMNTFDALMTKLDFSPVVINVGYSKVNEGLTGNSADDVNLVIVDANYMMEDVPVAEVYYVLNQQRKSDTGNAGMRFMSKFFNKAALITEVCYQYYNGVVMPQNKDYMSSRALQLVGVFYLSDFGKKPSVSVDYSHLSENWNPMYENWVAADIVDTLLPNTDADILGAALELQPLEALSFKVRYAYLKLVDSVPVFAVVDTAGNLPWGLYNTTASKGLGQEIDINTKYAFTENTDIGLDLAYYKPGNYFNDREEATQAMLSVGFSF